MKRKIVLFIGAGFNYEIGLPIISTFGEASDKQYIGVSDHNTRNSREAAGMLVQAGDISKEFQDYCKNASRFVNINCDNMEDIFCLAEILKQAGEQKIKLNNRDYKIEEIEESIKLWLWKIFQQCPPLTKKTDSKGREYKWIFEEI